MRLSRVFLSRIDRRGEAWPGREPTESRSVAQRRVAASRSATQPACSDAACRSSSTRHGGVEVECRGLAERRLHRPRSSVGQTRRRAAAKATAASSSLARRARTPTPARARRRAAVDARAEQRHRRGGLRPDGPVQHPGVPAARVQPDLQRSACRTAPTRPARRTSQRERQVQARPRPRGRSPRRPSAAAQSQHAQEPVVDRPDGAGVGLAVAESPRFDVSAPEQNAGRHAGHDERADGVVGLERVERRRRSRRPSAALRALRRLASSSVSDARRRRAARRAGAMGLQVSSVARPRRASGGRTSRRRARSGTSALARPMVCEAQRLERRRRPCPPSCTRSGTPPPGAPWLSTPRP